MSRKVKIERIVIRVGDKEIPLSMDEARELKGILAEMFGQNVYIPSAPVIIERPYRTYPYWKVEYGTNTATCTTTNTQ